MAIRIRFYLPAARRPVTGPHFLSWLRSAMDRARQRHKLGELDDRLLRDIGIARSQAREESSKPFWQVAHRE
jgi:uncharacterized protein YjiS (DUF1127 family)